MITNPLSNEENVVVDPLDLAESKFKTLRHIEVVRNHLNAVIIELTHRGETHDQCKLQEPEAEIFAVYMKKLRDVEYGSDEYKGYLKEMDPAVKHHYENSRHHPEFHENGINDMNLIDLLEMITDWSSSTLRHSSGDIMKSIDISQKRFGYSDELKQIFINTVNALSEMKIEHHAEES